MISNERKIMDGGRGRGHSETRTNKKLGLGEG